MSRTFHPMKIEKISDYKRYKFLKLLVTSQNLEILICIDLPEKTNTSTVNDERQMTRQGKRYRIRGYYICDHLE